MLRKPLGSIVIAACGVALLVDAAVETTRAGSPIRWWVIAALVADVLAAAAVWWRVMGARAQIAVAFATLLALAAITAWLPGGLTNGLAMFGQTTPRLLAAFAAAGVLLAGFALIRVQKLPLAARGAFGTFAVYGAAAFVLGAMDGVPMYALVRGDSLWKALPFVLQGAFIGGLVVLPVGLLTTILSGGVRRPAPESGRASAYRIVALVASLATVLAGVPLAKPSSIVAGGGIASSGSTPAVAGATAVNPETPSPLESVLSAIRRQPALSASERTTLLANSFRALEDGEREAPRDRWDLRSVAARLGNDPQRTFAWVRDSTYWIAYRGLLRGPVGVLMDRHGSDLDRADLLAMLLKTESRQVRLAHATLSRDQAVRLLPRLIVSGLASMPARAERPQGDPWTSIAAQYQLSEASLRATISAQTESRSRLRDDLQPRVLGQSKRLFDAIGGAELAKASTLAELQNAIETLRDHWWVQTLDNDSWHDLDLLSRDGSALASADRSIDPEDVPANDREQIVIRVIGEQLVDGALKERVALERPLRPSDLIGTPVSLRFAPGDWPKEFPQPGTSVAQSFRAAVLAQHDWTPVLIVGKERITQTAIADSGNLTMPTGYQDTLSMAKGVARGLGPALDDIFSAPTPQARPNAPPPAPGSFLTATWIEYEIDAPGQAPQKIRRAVFDLLGPSARARHTFTAPRLDQDAVLRRSLAMMTETEILPTVSRLAPEFVTHLAAQALLANRDVIISVVRGDVADDFDHAGKVASKLTAMPTSLYDFALARLRWSPVAGSVFVDRPNILTRHIFFVPNGTTFDLRVATDIVSNDVGVIPVVNPFTARLVQGVYDTNLESRLTTGRPDSSNTAWAFDSGEWTGVTSAQDVRLRNTRLSEDAKQQIADAVGGGANIVAPSAPVSIAGRPFTGWWQIDRRTGQTLGLDARGWGDAMPEYAVVLLTIGEAMALGFLSAYIFCRIWGGGGGGGGGPVARGCEPETKRRWLDYLEPTVHAQGGGCLLSALESAFLGAAAGAAGAGGGDGTGEPSGSGGEPAGQNGGESGGGGGNGAGDNGAGGNGGGANGAGGNGGGGNGGSGNGGNGNGGGGSGNGAGSSSENGLDMREVEAIRELARNNPGLSDDMKRTIPPPGAPPSKLSWDPSFRWPQGANIGDNGPAPVLNPVSPKSQTVVNYGNPVDPNATTQPVCPPNCSPLAKSLGGLGGVTQVLGSGK